MIDGSDESGFGHRESVGLDINFVQSKALIRTFSFQVVGKRTISSNASLDPEPDIPLITTYNAA